MSDDSVSMWLDQLKAGDREVVGPLWERYFTQLVRIARAKLSDRVRRVADEEDVALSAFHSFCRAADAGRLPRLDDRHDLWAVLVTLTERKVYAQIDREMAAKRGGGLVRSDSLGDQGIPSAEPSPAFAAEVAESCQHLLDRLFARDPFLRDIAIWKLEGYTNDEIAKRSGKSLATIERKLMLIRTLWSEDHHP